MTKASDKVLGRRIASNGIAFDEVYEVNSSGYEPLYHDAFFVQLYDLENPWSPDRTYCLKLANGCGAVLDLGCGTGSLAVEIAKTVPRVVGVDPASAMLQVARTRAGGDRVTWVQGDAREIALDETFDLIIVTGHAFQCFLTRVDRAALFAMIATHLNGHGRFIFDSRNPAREEWREWIPEQSRRTLNHALHGDVDAWNDVSFEAKTSIATYGTTYHVLATGKSHRTEARIAFPSRADIGAELSNAGLRVLEWLGDWDGRAVSDSSAEIIPIGGLKHNA